MIALEHPQLSIRRQCQLLGLHRSGLCYEPVEESAENHSLMQLLVRQPLIALLERQRIRPTGSLRH